MTPPVRMLHLTDPHLFAEPGSSLYGVDTADAFARVLRETLGGADRPDVILVTGDIGDDLTAAAYGRFRAAFDGCGVPVLCLAGNHDAPAVMSGLLDHDGFQYLGRAVVGDWGVVLVDSHVSGADHGCVAADELERLELHLKALAAMPVLVAIHHLPVAVGSPWLDAVGLANGPELLALLQRYPQVKVVVGGHVHQCCEVQLPGFSVLATPSTCAQFEPRTTTCAMDLKPPGYRWLQLQPDGEFQTQVAWLRDWELKPSLITTRS